MELEIKPPTPDSPGYLYRVKRALLLQRALTDGLTEEAIDNIIEFLIPYVVIPKDRGEAREALLDASETQFIAAINAVVGQGDAADPK